MAVPKIQQFINIYLGNITTEISLVKSPKANNIWPVACMYKLLGYNATKRTEGYMNMQYIKYVCLFLSKYLPNKFHLQVKVEVKNFMKL